MILWLFLVQLSLSLLAACLYSSRYNTYAKLEIHPIEDSHYSAMFMVFIRYFVLLSTLVPISLIVNIEIVRLAQSKLIQYNLDLTNHKE